MAKFLPLKSYLNLRGCKLSFVFLLILLAHNSNAQVNLDSGLVAYWPFNANAIDETGNVGEGTVFGAEPTTDRCEVDSSAYSFDGIDDEIEFPTSFMNLVDTFSLSAWVYLDDLLAEGHIFSSNSQIGSLSGVYLSITADTTVNVSYGDGGVLGPDSRRTKISATKVPLDQWVHIMAVVYGPTEMEIYINCENAGGEYSGTGGPLFNSFSWALAGHARHTSDYFLGKIDELRVYDRALTLDESQEFCVPILEVNLPADTTLCPGETLTINLPTDGGVTYMWQDSSTSASYTISSPGLYWVIATDDVCTASDSINVNYSDPLTVDLGPDLTLCEDDTITLNAYNPGATYLWSDESTDSALTVWQAGVYWVDVTDNCYTETDTVTIDVFDFPNFSLGEDTLLCGDQELLVWVSIPGATYLWQDNSTDTSYTITGPGLYWVDVTLNGCTKTDSILAEWSVITSVFLGNDTTFCEGEELILSTVATNANYLWSDQSTEPTLSVTETGQYWVQVSNNCTSQSDTINIEVNTTPFVQLAVDNDTILCQGEFLAYNFDYPGATYLWQDSSTSGSYLITEEGDYWVQATLGECTSYDELDVIISQNTELDLGGDTAFCEGGFLTLDVWSRFATYLWSDGTTSSQNTFYEAGTYWVQRTDACAIYSDTIQIDTIPLPVVNLGNDTVVCQEVEFYLDASTFNATYLWQDSSTAATYKVEETDDYWVEVTVENCSSVDGIEVELKNCDAVFDVSNVFTPNGDGINDKFTPFTFEYAGPSILRVYNRWGVQVYEGNISFGGWDGTYHNNECPAGTYYWFIDSDALVNDPIKKTGYLTLIRGKEDK